MSDTTRRDWWVAAELGVLALALGTTAGFNRLFIGWAFLGRLAPLVILAWASAVLLRRLRLPVAAALPVHLALGVVTLTVRFAPGTHLLGIPTPHTVRDVSAAVDASFSAFSRLIAPVEVTDGFLVVIAAALWIFAFFADTAALRFRGVLQAAVPHVAVFATVGILARDTGRIAAAVWFGLGLVTYAVTQVGRLGSDRRWVQGHATRGTRALARAAGAIAVLGLTAGALVGPLMPGSTQPVVDLRELGRGDGPRTVVSPFIGIRSLLGQRSDQIVFTVQSTEPAYWRLTALEEFDEERQIWVSSGSYANASGDLPRTDSAVVPGTPLEQSFRIEGLGGVWLPGAYVPDRVASDTPLSFDSSSASIILRDEADGPVSYDLVSAVPDFARLARSGAAVGRATADVDPVHLEVPELSGQVRDALADATSWAGSGPGSDYARMLALQDWFRDGFAYDERVDFSNELDPLDAFLAARRGFCQQYSSAFALMARALGMPTRIAVGFTPGDTAPPEAGDDPDRTRFVVRGRHAHAWPEVHFEGIGWVPFEPTPQRGDPQNRDHTGVSPAQAAPPERDTTTSTAAPDQPSGTTIPGPTTTADAREPRPGAADPSARGTGNDAGPVGPLLVGAAALVVALAATWWFRRRRVGSPGEALHRDRVVVATAWADATRSLVGLDLRPTPAETPLEFAHRVRRTLAEHPLAPDDTAPVGDEAEPWLEHATALTDAIATLADIETRARFRDGDLEPDEVTAAQQAARSVADHATFLGTYSSSERRNRSRARDPALLK